MKISQTALGAAIGVTFQQVQKYERGANRVSASRLDMIARALRVPVRYFFDRPSAADPLADFARLLDDPSCRKLNEAFLRIRHPAMRRLIVTLVEGAAVRDQCNGNQSH